jgi:hypothetical protein
MTTQEIAEATSLDPELSELRQAITTGKRLSKSLNHYRRMLSEMSVTREGIVLRDHRIVIPKSLRKRVVELAPWWPPKHSQDETSNQIESVVKVVLTK